MAYLGNTPQLSTMRTLVEGTAFSNQNEIPVPGGFNPSLVDVIIGGAELSSGDYDSSNGASIKLNVGMLAGTQFKIVAWTPNQTVVNASGQLASFRNRIINGDMKIDQRNSGASVNITNSNTGMKTVDRWSATVDPALSATYTAQRVVDGPNGSFPYSLKLTVGTAWTPTATNYGNHLMQWIEKNNVIDFGYGLSSAKTCTVSFWVKASVIGTYSAFIYNIGGASSTPRTNVTPFTVNSSNTWEFKTITFIGDVGATTWQSLADIGQGLLFGVDLGSGTNRATSNTGIWQENTAGYVKTSNSVNLLANSGATFQLTGVQIEEGSVATRFEQRPYQTEIVFCQRYYRRPAGCTGSFISSTVATIGVALHGSPLRTQPTIEYASTGQLLDPGVAFRDITAIAVNSVFANGGYLDINTTGATSGRPCVLVQGAGYLALNAEL